MARAFVPPKTTVHDDKQQGSTVPGCWHVRTELFVKQGMCAEAQPGKFLSIHSCRGGLVLRRGISGWRNAVQSRAACVVVAGRAKNNTEAGGVEPTTARGALSESRRTR